MGDPGGAVTELQEGAVVGGLRIDGILGRGAMGVVYRAFDTRLERVVALKVIATEHAADPTFRRLFLREARTAAGLSHPHVVTVHRYDDADGLVFLVTQFVDGTDLKVLIDDSGRLEPRLAVTLIGQVALALDAAHATALVHRDVKPANILVAGLPSRPHAYLSDFGLARAMSMTQLSSSTALAGSPAYMAPELLLGAAPAGVATDVYALGKTLFQALAGELPRFGARIGTPGATLQNVLPDRVVARALDEVVRRATAEAPGERFRSAGELAAVARAAVGGARSTNPAPGPSVPPRSSGTHRRKAGAPTGPSYVAPGPAPPDRAPRDPELRRPDSPQVAAPGRARSPGAAPPPRGSAAAAPPMQPWYTAPLPVRSGPDRGHGPQRALEAPETGPASLAHHHVVPVVAALVAVALFFAVVAGVDAFVDDREPATPASSTAVTLQSVTDGGGTVTLTWAGPANLDYAVEVTPRGSGTSGSSTVLAGRVTTLTAAVTPGVPYCFRVTATDAARVLSSNAQSIRGARC